MVNLGLVSYAIDTRITEAIFEILDNLSVLEPPNTHSRLLDKMTTHHES